MKTSISPFRSIITRYLGPTNFRGSRIVADAGKACRLTLSWDYSLENNIEANHKTAAMHSGPRWAGLAVIMAPLILASLRMAVSFML